MRQPVRHRVPRLALVHLSANDAAMEAVIERVGPCRIERTAGSDFEALIRAIVYQQLSGKAAGTIYARFVALFPRGRYPSAHAIQACADAELRGVGVSRAKMLAIRDLCSHVTGRALPFLKYPQMAGWQLCWPASGVTRHTFGRPPSSCRQTP